MPTLSSGIARDATPVEPALYGLLSPATTVVEETDDHFANGFDYETIECGATVRLSSLCAGMTSVSAVNPSGGPLYRHYFPFTVDTTFKCSTMGTSPDEVREIAGKYLRVAVQKGAELELWAGALSKAAEATTSYDEVLSGPYPNRYLAASTAVDKTPTPGTGVKARYAVALLEKALADTGIGIRGTLHIPRDVASVLNFKPKGDDDENGYIVTNLGNYVVAGSGYTGTGPTGVHPGVGKAWVYATGPVTVRLGETYIVPDKNSQAVDISINTTQYFASQVAAVTWNSCAHFAVLVDLSLDYS